MNPEQLLQLLQQIPPEQLQGLIQQLGQGDQQQPPPVAQPQQGAQPNFPVMSGGGEGYVPPVEGGPASPNPTVDAILAEKEAQDLFAKSQEVDEWDPWDTTGEEGIGNRVIKKFPSKAIDRMEKYADAGEGFDKPDKRGFGAEQGMQGLMAMASQIAPQQQKQQMPGYQNKIIQGLLGGM